MKKQDIFIGLVIGFLIGVLSLAMLKNIEVGLQQQFSWFSAKMFYPLPVVFAALMVVGLFVADLISKKIKFIWQLAKFVSVGALNTFIDLGILNLLILISGIAQPKGGIYVLFKFLSFSAAATNSYFWNKWWTFEKGRQLKGKEFINFYLVTGVGMFINVGVASFLVNITGALFGFQEQIWAGVIAPFMGVLIGFIWNFLAYKFFIFKK